MAFSGNSGFTRIIKACQYSWQGLSAAYKHEAAFRQEIWASLVLVPSSFWLGNDATEKALLVGTVFLVLIVEILNSSIEAVVDRIGEEQHELAGRAKDMGSAAVAIAILLLIVVWVLVLVG